MKKLLILSVVMVIGLTAASVADAQFTRPKKTPGGGTTPTTTTPTTTTPTTTKTGGGTSGGSGTKPGKIIDTSRSSTGKEYGGVVKPSLRSTYGYDTTSSSLVKDRKPLAYENLREDDIMFSHFIWREIDTREKMNKVFSYPAKENGEDQRFFAIILDALKNDSVMAFSAEDDRFTTPLGYDTIMSLVSAAGNDLDTQYTANPYDPNIIDTFISRRTNPFAPKPDSIYTFRLMERVMFDKESSRLFTRIIGIAPVAKIGAPPGTPGGIQSTSKTLFWVYYPDLRPKLARTFAYNPRNSSGRMTWEEIFESRFFSSYIVKTSMDNPTDATLKELIKDPLFRLLEGENIKEKIFNYEQNLWAY